LISARFSASFLLGAVMRTSSQPASIMRMLWATVAAVSIVSVVVMLCTRMGLSTADADITDAHGAGLPALVAGEAGTVLAGSE
jgi:hypothetical protein